MQKFSDFWAKTMAAFLHTYENLMSGQLTMLLVLNNRTLYFTFTGVAIGGNRNKHKSCTH